MKKNIYLDHAATTPLTDSVKEYLISILDDFGNPSSLYGLSERPKQIISEARQSIARFINADPDDVYFTGGGSSSNTLSIRGFYLKNNCTIFYSPITHKSVLKCVETYHNSIPLQVNKEGSIDIPGLEKYLDICTDRPFVIIDHANSEIGTVQNIEEIIRITHLHGGVVYLDCTGSIPAIPMDVKKSDVDMLGFSGHKLHALKGCGILYKKKDIILEPLVYGSQEKGLCSGTENILGIASLGRAVEEYDYSTITSYSRDHVYDYIAQKIPNSYLAGASIESGSRLPHNLYICFKGVEGESLMILLDMNGIQVSTGSACTSGDLAPSAALSAIGMDKRDIHSCIRMTFGGNETTEELDHVCETLRQCVESLRSFNGKERT